MKRKFVWYAIAAVVTLLGLAQLAQPVNASNSANSTQTKVGGTVSWTIPAGQCSSLPAGLSVSGTGTRSAVIITQTDAAGNQTILINDLVKGDAADSDGGTYHFVYHNHSTELVPAGGGAHQVNMADSFDLNGNGGVNNMSVGFNWRWTFTPPAGNWPPHDNWQQLSTRGDPLTCDPI